MAPVDYFDIFEGVNKQWYWNLHDGGNHAIIATGGEGFVSYSNAQRAIKGFRQTVLNAYIPTGARGSMATDDLLDDIDEDTPDFTGVEDDEPMERDSD